MKTLKVGVIDISIAVHAVQRDIVHLTTATQSVTVQSVLSGTGAPEGALCVCTVVVTSTLICLTFIDI